MRRQFIMSLILTIVLVSCGQPVDSTTASLQGAQPAQANPMVATVQPSQAEVLTEATAIVFRTRFRVTTYQGQPLPTPDGGEKQSPPPAWLVVGDQITPATFGSANQLEAPPPELMDQVATVDLSSKITPVIIVGAGPIEEFWVGVRPWGDYTAQSTTLTASQQNDQPTAFTLEPISNTRDQVLHVFVRFGYDNGGDATYIWRLNPSSS
jgi:hypothetical protein